MRANQGAARPKSATGRTRRGEFDIKAFHDQILNGGAMPLDLLQERVEAWIKAQGSAKS